MTTDQKSYGCYGKVPCVGDFVRRGLSQQFIAGWDSWMQTVLINAQVAMKERWSECYLSAPIWRFALSAGLCGPRTVAGIVMPSVDRVGRRFPLCIATETNGSAHAALFAMQPVITQLEEIALGMLDDIATLDWLDDQLSTLPAPSNVQLVDSRSQEKSQNSEAIWITSGQSQSHVLITDTMPNGPIQVKALFDLQDPYWQQTLVSDQGNYDDPISDNSSATLQ